MGRALQRCATTAPALAEDPAAPEPGDHREPEGDDAEDEHRRNEGAPGPPSPVRATTRAPSTPPETSRRGAGRGQCRAGQVGKGDGDEGEVNAEAAAPRRGRRHSTRSLLPSRRREPRSGPAARSHGSAVTASRRRVATFCRLGGDAGRSRGQRDPRRPSRVPASPVATAPAGHPSPRATRPRWSPGPLTYRARTPGLWSPAAEQPVGWSSFPSTPPWMSVGVYHQPGVTHLLGGARLSCRPGGRCRRRCPLAPVMTPVRTVEPKPPRA